MASPEFGRLQGQITDPIYVVDVSGTSTSTSITGTVFITGSIQLNSGSVSIPLYFVQTVPPSGTSTNPANRLSLLEGGLHAISGAVTGSRELYVIEAMNNSSSILYLHIYNTGSLPAANAVPRYVFAVSPLTAFSRDLSVQGGELYASNGISFAWSTGSEQLGQPTLALCRNTWCSIWYR